MKDLKPKVLFKLVKELQPIFPVKVVTSQHSNFLNTVLEGDYGGGVLGRGIILIFNNEVH